MHGTFPIAAYRLAALLPIAGSGSGVSEAALLAERAASDVVRLTERSQALFGEKSTLISCLLEIADACATADWDGNEALPVSRNAVAMAEAFIRALPDGMDLPELAPEPDGEMSLDWIVSPHRVFSVSTADGHRLAYAWLDGIDKGHGVARFDGRVVPSRILSGLQEILGNGVSALRVA